MQVWMADVDEEDLPLALEEVTAASASGASVMSSVCDVSDIAQVRALKEKVYTAWGECGVLCNNAGVGLRGPPGKVIVFMAFMAFMASTHSNAQTVLSVYFVLHQWLRHTNA